MLAIEDEEQSSLISVGLASRTKPSLCSLFVQYELYAVVLIPVQFFGNIFS